VAGWQRSGMAKGLNGRGLRGTVRGDCSPKGPVHLHDLHDVRGRGGVNHAGSEWVLQLKLNYGGVFRENC
jgi:hypothetical protein